MTETETSAFDKPNSAENPEPVPIYPEDEHRFSGLRYITSGSHTTNKED